jgi:hypothetical protein
LEALARKHHFTQRQSKLSACEFVDTLMFSQLDHSQVSLQDCCNDLSQQRQKQYSKVALHKRFNQRSVDFLKGVLAEQLADHPAIDHESLWNPFNRILIGDSCKFSIPEHLGQDYPGFHGCRPAKAIMNLQYGFDLKNGHWQYLEFTKATENDQRYSAEILDDIQANDLLLRDLGFVTQQYLQTIINKKAYFINRMPPTWSAFQKENGKKINWKSINRKIKKYDLGHMEIEVMIGKENIKSRLVVSVVPLSIYQDRLRKVEKHARSKGVQVSDEYKIRCRLNAFVTNIPKELLAHDNVSKVYRTRWQIELVFKTWKSLLLIHKTKPVKKHRFECQLLAKFIWVLLNWKIFQAISKFILKESPNNNCSLWKFFKQARHHSYSLRMVIAGTLRFEQWCKIYIYPIVRHLLIEPKNEKIPHHQILNKSFSLG